MTTSRQLPTSTMWFYAVLVVAVGSIVRLAMLSWMTDDIWGALTKWDARYYVAIAKDGYFDSGINADETLAFFPGFPMVMRLVHMLTGIDFAVAGMLVNLLFTVVMAVGVMNLSKHPVAAAFVVTSAPMSTVFMMPYTEALFGALAVWALVMLLRRNWLAVAALIFLLSFVRLTAIAFVPVLVACVLLWGRKDWRAWLALLSPAPLVGYLVWASSHLQPWGGYFGIQSEHWNSQFDFGQATMRWLLEESWKAEYLGYRLTTLAIVGAVVVLVCGWRMQWPVWLFCASLAGNVLLSDGIMHSRPRLLLPVALMMVPWLTQWWLVAGWVLFGAWFSAHMLAVFPWAL